jgi:hypothetical protein
VRVRVCVCVSECVRERARSVACTHGPRHCRPQRACWRPWSTAASRAINKRASCAASAPPQFRQTRRHRHQEGPLQALRARQLGARHRPAALHLVRLGLHQPCCSHQRNGVRRGAHLPRGPDCAAWGGVSGAVPVQAGLRRCAVARQRRISRALPRACVPALLPRSQPSSHAHCRRPHAACRVWCAARRHRQQQGRVHGMPARHVVGRHRHRGVQVLWLGLHQPHRRHTRRPVRSCARLP